LTRDAPAWFHPAARHAMRLGPKIVLAHFRRGPPRRSAALDVAGPVAAFKVFLDALPPQRKKGLAAHCPRGPDLLPVHRDFAFVLDAAVPAATSSRRHWRPTKS